MSFHGEKSSLEVEKSQDSKQEQNPKHPFRSGMSITYEEPSKYDESPDGTSCKEFALPFSLPQDTTQEMLRVLCQHDPQMIQRVQQKLDGYRWRQGFEKIKGKDGDWMTEGDDLRRCIRELPDEVIRRILQNSAEKEPRLIVWMEEIQVKTLERMLEAYVAWESQPKPINGEHLLSDPKNYERVKISTPPHLLHNQNRPPLPVYSPSDIVWGRLPTPDNRENQNRSHNSQGNNQNLKWFCCNNKGHPTCAIKPNPDTRIAEPTPPFTDRSFVPGAALSNEAIPGLMNYAQPPLGLQIPWSCQYHGHCHPLPGLTKAQGAVHCTPGLSGIQGPSPQYTGQSLPGIEEFQRGVPPTPQGSVKFCAAPPSKH